MTTSNNKSNPDHKEYKVARITGTFAIIAVIITGLFTVYTSTNKGKEDNPSTKIETKDQKGGVNIGVNDGNVNIYPEQKIDTDCENLIGQAKTLYSTIKSKNPHYLKYQSKKDRDIQYFLEKLEEVQKYDCSKVELLKIEIKEVIDSANKMLNND